MIVLLSLFGACTPSPERDADLESGKPSDTAGPAPDSGPFTDTGPGGDTAVIDTSVPSDTADTADTAGSADTAPKTLCAVLRRDDLWADGHYESGYRSRIDGLGNLVLEEYTDGDGVAGVRVEYLFDARSNLLVQTDDLEANGVVDVTRTWTYDLYDNELTYAANGLWTSDTSWTYTYDADGNVLVGEYDGYGDHTDGVTDRRVAYTYDTDGNAVLETHDYDVDGDSELTISRAWSSGDLQTEAWDYDGLVDSWGTPYEDYSYAYTYDADGNLSSITYDVGNPGSADVWTYTYDGSGNVLTMITDYAGDGVIDGSQRYSYDGDGNVLTLESMVDGVWELSRVYTYASARLTRADQYRNGLLAWWLEYGYDSAGDITEMVQYSSDGDAEYRSSYTYDCDF